MGGALYLTKKLHTRLLKDKQIKRTIVRRGTRGGDFDIHLIYMVLQCFCIPQTFFWWNIWYLVRGTMFSNI
jgi:hypothetical protein